MYASFFDVTLDVINIIPLPFKLFSIYIVRRHSPSNMDSLPLFILNVMMWELLGSVYAIIEHAVPILPFQCFHVDGVIILFTNSEVVYHIITACLLITRMNCSLAQFFAFPYRYLILVYPKKILKVSPKWGSAFCASLHAVYSIIFVVMYANIVGYYVDYPFLDNRPLKREIFCFDPNRKLRDACSLAYTVLTLVLVALTVVFSLLLVRHFRKMIQLYNKQTLEMHRKFLRSLIIITAVPILFGLLPHAIGALNTVFFPGYPLETYMLTAVMSNLDGTLFYVVCIFTFEPYRQAALKIASQMFSRRQVSKVSPVSVLPI
ncbi:hypothetical protein QR680_015466 [Steinernema hermaphroditum]|uniref:G-protein coupled receptors family 1 profile domain-containing protein n=1 Tax=Steinernema hermaphroditum TaxID=289476 RepID=A0AA39HAC5_9BILA|nr:hypothetical protein QR680_015466 [Steinernema hermaphroditum]